MKITILGSGTCFPLVHRSSCSILIENDKSKLLFDIGAGTIRRLTEANKSIFDISMIFLSHFHPDHSGELVSFLFSSKYALGVCRDTPFSVIGGKGFIDFYDRLKNAFGEWIELPNNILQLQEINDKGIDKIFFKDFIIETSSVKHREESIAYKISVNGKSVVYSGDTDYCQSLIDLAKNCDILISECSLPDDMKIDGHLTPSLAGKIASEANVKKLILTHIYPPCDDENLIKSQCGRMYSGKLIIAEDLMEIYL
ncbi:MAG: MBL fold metallo-hydrolase [Desulfamplus sp.]|nr:MBL fold metallo-hydrolase [Desulfamplus sp.]